MSDPGHSPVRRPASHRLVLACLTAAAVLFAAAAPPAEAQLRPRNETTPAIDPDTGRDNRVWPPDVLFDYRHMRLEMDIPDMDQPRFRARNTLRMAPQGASRSSVTLDAGPGLTINAVTVDGAPAQFERAPSKLTIRFPRAYAMGEELAVAIDYDADQPGGRGEGLTFSKDDPRTPEHDPMCHAQGQPQSNHLWFPCHDFPNDRLATELVVNVPPGFTAVSNGRLMEVRKHPPEGRTTFHWRQELPHPVYLVTLIVSKFDIVDVGGPDTARPGLWMPVYGPLGSAEALRRNFANTPDMIAHFEELFAQPFPWDKYANIICRDFAAGAMENTSAVTWGPFGATGPRAAIEGTNAHELVHHWFGNLVTCKSWEHLWLNEGWASFGEALWAEKARGENGYRRAITGFAAQTRSTARNFRPGAAGMVSNLYSHPDERFFAADNVYPKGGWILHALRSRLGDRVFWEGVHLYLQRHKFTQVETDDFRKALEEVSGQSLERFFDQFVIRPGVPRVDVDLEWDDAVGGLRVRLEQMQTVDADNPAFAFDVPLRLEFEDGDPEFVYVGTDERTAEAVLAMNRKPTRVSVDPTATIPASFRIRTNLAMLLDELRRGPTPYARLLAADALAETADWTAAAALARSAFADLTAAPSVRTASRRALARMTADAADRTVTLVRSALEQAASPAVATGGQ